MDIEGLIEEGHIQRIKPSGDLSEKEFREADYDLEKAKEELENEDYKWAIVKGYFAVFHSARGVMFIMGYREKSHFAVREFLDTLCTEGKLENSYVADFRAALSARQSADYHYDYSKKRAIEIVELADEFVERMKKLKSEI